MRRSVGSATCIPMPIAISHGQRFRRVPLSGYSVLGSKRKRPRRDYLSSETHLVFGPGKIHSDGTLQPAAHCAPEAKPVRLVRLDPAIISFRETNEKCRFARCNERGTSFSRRHRRCMTETLFTS